MLKTRRRIRTLDPQSIRQDTFTQPLEPQQQLQMLQLPQLPQLLPLQLPLFL